MATAKSGKSGIEKRKHSPKYALIHMKETITPAAIRRVVLKLVKIDAKIDKLKNDLAAAREAKKELSLELKEIKANIAKSKKTTKGKKVTKSKVIKKASRRKR